MYHFTTDLNGVCEIEIYEETKLGLKSNKIQNIWVAKIVCAMILINSSLGLGEMMFS